MTRCRYRGRTYRGFRRRYRFLRHRHSPSHRNIYRSRGHRLYLSDNLWYVFFLTHEKQVHVVESDVVGQEV